MYKFIFNNFCFILTATPADHFFWVLSFTEFIKSSCTAKWIQNLWNYSQYQIISLPIESLQWMYSLSSLCTHTRICIYTHTVINYVRTHTHIQNCSKYWTAYIYWKKFLPISVLQRKFLAFISHMEGVYRLVNKYGKKILCTGMIFTKATVQEKRPWDHQVSDVSFYKLPFPLLLALWFHIHCCMVSFSHLTA